MTSFLLAPITSFFSRRLYQKASQSGFGIGLLYLLYLTILFCIVIAIVCQTLLLPLMSEFSDWLIGEMPELTLTAEGLTADVAQPYLITHPTYGPLVLIDTTKETPELMKEIEKAPFVIGKKDIIAQNESRGQSRTFSLKEAMLKAHEAKQPIRLTKERMREFANQIKKLTIPFILFFAAPTFYIWKLISALFYSLIAMILNSFKKEKYNYQGLFVMTCCTITPVVVIQAISLSVPMLKVNLNFISAFALTFFYLIFAMFVAARPKTEVTV